jgi:hypothetical protein
MVSVLPLSFASAPELSVGNARIAPSAKVTTDIFSIDPFFIVFPFPCR